MSMTLTNVRDRVAAQPFNTLGEQLIAVAQSASGHGIDPRLQRMAAVSGMSEGVPSDGGFAVQSDFAQEIITRAYNTGEILSRCDRTPIGPNSNSLKVNAIDETSRANGSRFGGVQVFWANEADTVAAKKPKLRQMELNLRKLIGLWYVTDELMQDSTALSSIAEKAFAQEVQFMVEDAILASGTGVGQPQAIMKSAALITVAKEGSQATGSVLAANLTKMYARMWAPSRKNAVWLINQDVEAQLQQLTLGGTAQAFPVYLPPGGFSVAPYATLFGKPVIPVEYCASLSSLGDIVLADLSEYLLIDKPAKVAGSIHVRFLNDENVFRITYRVDGQPKWNSALTPKNGSNTLSPFVTLQAR
jgi:HK97 family phage major capsid protein